MKLFLAGFAFAFAAGSGGAGAGVIGIEGGPDAMDAVVGGMEGIPGQELPEGSLLTNIPTPLGDLVCSDTHQQLYVGSGWDLWRPGYTEDVYFIEAGESGAVSADYDLPDGVVAFDFFIQDNDRSSGHRFIVTAFTNDGDSVTLQTGVFESDGAHYFGFYGTDGDTIDRVEITAANASGGWAIGEWRIVPAPGGALALASLGALIAVSRRRQR